MIEKILVKTTKDIKCKCKGMTPLQQDICNDLYDNTLILFNILYHKLKTSNDIFIKAIFTNPRIPDDPHVYCIPVTEDPLVYYCIYHYEYGRLNRRKSISLEHRHASGTYNYKFYDITHSNKVCINGVIYSKYDKLIQEYFELYYEIKYMLFNNKYTELKKLVRSKKDHNLSTIRTYLKKIKKYKITGR